MIALVKAALRFPYASAVMAILIVLGGVWAAARTPVDILPSIDIPVVAVAFTYSGLSPADMSGRILTPYQRALSTSVNDIEHIEATSYPGTGIVKIFFHPDADIRLANAQITAASQSMLRQMPTGTTPPLVVNYSASSTPVLQLALAGEGLTEQQLLDAGVNVIRARLVTIAGAVIPYPFGGRSRQIQIDLDPHALAARGLSAASVPAAIAAQTQITPGGFVKIGAFQYSLRLNNAPGSVADLSDLPIRTIDGAVVRVGDVAQVRDGSAPQQNVVHVEGARSALLTIYKNGATSTLSVVRDVRAALPGLAPDLPPTLSIRPLNDQAVFVRSAIDAVVHEGLLAGGLTALLVLMFLGSWRSTVIIALTIPLAILAALAVLSLFGQTINIMTLGGLALAVGMLVDDATVTIENIEVHLENGADVRTAILDSAARIVGPALVSLLCICAAFAPMFFLPGISGFLFAPMALSVISAMVASFLLSRTLVPVLAMRLLRPRRPSGESGAPGAPGWSAPLRRFQQGFARRFEGFRDGYRRVLGSLLARRRRVVVACLLFAAASLLLTPLLGRIVFPAVDSGAIALHVRGPAGLRLEETAALLERVEEDIRRTIPESDLETVANNIGLPISSLGVIYNASGTIGPQDGDIMITLKPGHRPTADYVRALRARLPAAFPEATFSFMPADVTSQILNFGAPAPIDVQVTGGTPAEAMAHAQKILGRIRQVKGLADARIHQPLGVSELRFDADRTRMSALGVTQADVTNGVAGAVAGTSQTAPVFWLNPENGVAYPVAAQTPEYRLDGLDALSNLPIAARDGQIHVLGALGSFSRAPTQAAITQYNIQPTINVYAALQDRDLGGVIDDVQRVIATLEPEKPARLKVALRGQNETLSRTFTGLGVGLLGAVILIYLLIVVAFQSWRDPLVVVSALPLSLAGAVWLLFAVGVPLSAPALTGAILCMGVATANSVLVISFARTRLALHADPVRAAFEAGADRFRPVLMTALAMMVGMTPMALGLGEGGEQNAPLGLAVIGGLLFGMIASLVYVPALFALLHAGDRGATPPSAPGHVDPAGGQLIGAS